MPRLQTFETSRVVMMLSFAEETILFNCSLVVLHDINMKAILNAEDSHPHWDPLFEQARAHGIHMLMYNHLKALGVLERIPKEAKEAIENARQSQLLLHIVFKEELFNVIHAFIEAGITPMPLKACSLWKSVYPDDSLRPSYDMDLLVSKDKWRRTLEIMKKLDYEPIDSPNTFSVTYQKKKNSQIVIEISTELQEIREHGRLILPKVSEIWERSRSSKLLGFPVKLLSLEDELLYLVSHHVSTHYLMRLVWLCDIVEFMRCNEKLIDWGFVLTQAGKLHQVTALNIVLFLAEQLGNFDSIKNRIPRSKGISLRLLKKIYRPTDTPGYPEIDYLLYRKDAIRILLIDGLRNKIVIVVRRFIQGQAWLKARYSEYRFKNIYLMVFLYHLFLLFLKCVRAALQLGHAGVSHDKELNEKN